jgi:hypothetical protein
LLGRVIGALGFTFRDEVVVEIEMIDIPDRLRRDVIVSRGGPLPFTHPQRSGRRNFLSLLLYNVVN